VQTAQTSKQDTKEGFRHLHLCTGFFTISQAGSGFTELLAKSAAHENMHVAWSGLEHCQGNWTLLLAPCRNSDAFWPKLQLGLTALRARKAFKQNILQTQLCFILPPPSLLQWSCCLAGGKWEFPMTNPLILTSPCLS